MLLEKIEEDVAQMSEKVRNILIDRNVPKPARLLAKKSLDGLAEIREINLKSDNMDHEAFIRILEKMTELAFQSKQISKIVRDARK